MDVDGQDMVPPKDPYIQVRVLDDIGDNLSLGDHSFSLTKNSVHSVRRTDAEQYISQVGFAPCFPRSLSLALSGGDDGDAGCWMAGIDGGVFRVRAETMGFT